MSGPKVVLCPFCKHGGPEVARFDGSAALDPPEPQPSPQCKDCMLKTLYDICMSPPMWVMDSAEQAKQNRRENEYENEQRRRRRLAQEKEDKARQ